MTENSIRKQIWDRKARVDAKIAEPGFLELSDDEQDAAVIALQLDVPEDVAARCVADEATADEMTLLRERLSETFRFGKRKALRDLKEAILHHPHLKPENDVEEPSEGARHVEADESGLS